jgi:hypothetical protein
MLNIGARYSGRLEAGQGGVAGRAANALLLSTFTGAIFVSAALLFLVQPMVTKLVLPRFGGAPSVWSIAIVFFQTTLLAGYGYAHWLTRAIPIRAACAVHALAILAAALLLPLAIVAGSSELVPGTEAISLVALLAVSIGPPFFVLAATSPLLQAWFARTGHPAAANPYFLYAGSNLGSFLALLSYPVLIEPHVGLHDQTRYWSILFYALIGLIAACGVWVWRTADKNAPLPLPADADMAPTWRNGLCWAALAAVPSGLLVAVTAHISTDIAAVPLLWIVPLALYLLSFVIVFARRPLIPHWTVVVVQPVFIIALVALIVFELTKTILWVVLAHVSVFFVCALMCHGEIARTRPAPQHLTSFYLWISAGGVVGGLSAGLIAPHVFNWVAEYPLLIALAALCRPGFPLPADRRWRYAALIALVAAAALLISCKFFPFLFDEKSFNRTAALMLLASLAFARAPLAFSAIVGSVLFANHILFEEPGTIALRSFFGVARVVESPDHQFRILQHGTTMHGAQRIRDEDGEPVTGPPEPLLYYWDGSAIAQTFEAARASTQRPVRHAVIGLGTGSLACRARPEDSIDYFEIDPAIVRIAQNRNLFTFLWICRPDVPIVLGDARLTLAQAPAGAYDLIVVDAFSSDAIPVHLLTREAMAVYRDKLSPHGIIVMHVSNRHLELASVVAGIAAANGLLALLNDSTDVDELVQPYKYASTIVAVAREKEDFGPLTQAAGWTELPPDPSQQVWTDNYSNVLGAVLRKLRE